MTDDVFEIDWEKKPEIREERLFRIQYDSRHYTYLKVADDGYSEIQDWYWNGLRPNQHGSGYRLSEPEDVKKWDTMTEIWDWLKEWEIVELRPIGPEDSEYFVTDEFVMKEWENNDEG